MFVQDHHSLEELQRLTKALKRGQTWKNLTRRFGHVKANLAACQPEADQPPLRSGTPPRTASQPDRSSASTLKQPC